MHQSGHPVWWLLERLMAGQDTTIASLSRIETRLEHGDDRMTSLDTRVTALEKAPATQQDQPSRVERMVMRWSAYLIPAGALWATGSVDAAVKFTETVAKLAAALK